MTDSARLLQGLVEQMRQPIRGIPFHLIVEALASKRVVPFDPSAPADAQLLQAVEQAVRLCVSDLKANPIVRPRPNEVGNDLEEYAIRALRLAGLNAGRPTTGAGMGKSTGYPDILVHDAEGRPTYVECKIFTRETANTTMRSFYLSPSESFKVAVDARHLLMAFEMEARAVSGSRSSEYRPTAFKVVDLYHLLCDVKFEFNSDNRRLYSTSNTLLSGTV